MKSRGVETVNQRLKKPHKVECKNYTYCLVLLYPGFEDHDPEKKLTILKWSPNHGQFSCTRQDGTKPSREKSNIHVCF